MENNTWHWPLDTKDRILPDEPGWFGTVRSTDVHTGVDLYCKLGTKVLAVEDGTVEYVEAFTGPEVGSPWWNSTKIIIVRGATGYVGYGEVSNVLVVPGEIVKAGQILGTIEVPVLKTNKGRPMVMLHLELYSELIPDTDGTHTVWWKLGESQPKHLLNPIPYLLNIATGSFELSSYDGKKYVDPSAPKKDSDYWHVWNIACIGLLLEGEQFLMLHRTPEDRAFPDSWCFPGGKQNPKETLEQTVCREFFEETNLNVKVVTKLNTIQTQRYTIVVYLLAQTSKNFLQLSDEHDDFYWFTKQDDLNSVKFSGPVSEQYAKLCYQLIGGEV